MSKNQKNNAMRMLEHNKIEYETKEYEYDESDLSGLTLVAKTGMNPDTVFKTLVLKGEKNGYLVCCIPVAQEINLKKLASASEDKKVEMIHVKELLPLTGYIRGGCSPIGMKKLFPTFIEESCVNFEKISISAGVRGQQIILNPKDLIEFLNAKLYQNN